ncbi:pilus assembly protein TadG-related protein [Limimaricola soesokkakensis]|uniref:pilus assembly protein TadG-related protein n=1 Tax=Limimaricola soesokkakensis TaxID=1343159 RepID=UPI0035160BAE
MIRSRLEAFGKDRNGAVIIFVALAMPVLVGGMGLGGEAGYRYYNQRLLQHAADFAAHAGAVRKYKGDERSAIDAAALHVAASSGYEPTLGPPIVINIPPQSGAFTGDPSAVEVILTETRPRLFSAIFSEEPVIIGARAVAAASGESYTGCILALSSTTAGAVTVTGSTSVNLSGCSVASNSTASNSFNMSGMGSSITTDCVSTVGGASTTTNLTLTECDAVLTNSTAVQDPYYWVMEPDMSTISCENTKSVGHPTQATPPVTATQTWTHPSGTAVRVRCFQNGLDVKGNVDFEPGLYIIKGSALTAGGSTTPLLRSVAGSGTPSIPPGVTFFFTEGGFAKLNGTANLQLSAPTTGPFAGILFFGSRSETGINHIINGGASSELQGAIYTPASHVQFSGNSDAASGCTQVIANTITLTGNSDISVECDTAGTEEILVGNLISVVE